MKRGVAMVGLMALAALGACARADDQSLAKLQPGQTTVEDAVQSLGCPDRDETLSDGSRMLTYVNSSARPYLVNFVPLANNVWGGWYGSHQEAGLMFGTDGHLRFWSWSTNGSKTIRLAGRDTVPHVATDLEVHGETVPSPSDGIAVPPEGGSAN